MICKKTSIKACAFVMIVAMMLLSMTGGAGAVPVEEWNKTFGGQYWDEAYSVQKVPDGGYIIIGSTNLWDTGEYGATWLSELPHAFAWGFLRVYFQGSRSTC